MFIINTWAGVWTIAVVANILIDLLQARRSPNSGKLAELKSSSLSILVFGVCSSLACMAYYKAGYEVWLPSVEENLWIFAAGVVGYVVSKARRQSSYSSAKATGGETYAYDFSLKFRPFDPKRIFLRHSPLEVTFKPKDSKVARIDCEVSFSENDLIRIYEGIKSWYIFTGEGATYVDYDKSNWLGMRKKCLKALEEYIERFSEEEMNVDLPEMIASELKYDLEQLKIFVDPHIYLRRKLVGGRMGSWITVPTFLSA